ncbi:MAG: ornithine cyclodeaminase family protein [Lawsonibacter sp.]|jgi:ornithine cyclodeaminase/alanine dehydrogenase-like protein (mu-crystallin family)
MSKVDILFLNNKDMEELGCADMPAVIHDVERAYILTEEGDVLVPGKCVMRWGKTPEDENVYGRINAMPGYIGGEYNMAGIKWIGSGPMNYKKGLPRASVTVVLNDPDTKLPVCIADGTQVSAKRTGASGGVAMKLLSREDATVLTICGAGAQGRTQLEAALIVRPTIKKVYVYDIRLENSQRFAQEAKEKYPGVEVIPVESPEQAVRESDITVCVTLANEPIVHSEWLKKGCLLMNLADYEVTYDCVRKADKIVVDNWDTIKHRMVSTVAMMWRDGIIKDEDIDAQLGQILTGAKKGRENDDQIIYFNAVGTGILDLAVTTRCYHKAMELGKGTKVPYWV